MEKIIGYKKINGQWISIKKIIKDCRASNLSSPKKSLTKCIVKNYIK